MLAADAAAREAVVAALRSTFAAHGAVGMDSNQVGYALTTVPGDAVRLLSASGKVRGVVGGGLGQKG